jgi:DNA repair exonuclease SbcCD ATPase subunit
MADQPGQGGAQPAQGAGAHAGAGAPKALEKVQKEIEKGLLVKEKLEIKEQKLEFKEAKNDIKEHKDAKNEFKEHKDEFKEHKNEFKEHTHEFKEIKQELEKLPKFGIKEVDKQIPDKLPGKEVVEGPLGPGGDPGPFAGVSREALEAHAGALEQAAQQVRHFIEQSDRPDLGEAALRNEPDQPAGG